MTSPPLNPADPILLIDDEPSWLHSLALNLEYFGNYNHLIPCSDSREALGLLRSRRFSVILLDLVMPHIEGTDLLVQLAQDFPETPVIILSGLNQLETAVRCMKLGAFDYHVKTAEPDRLWTTIRRALELTELSRENRELGTRMLAVELRQPQAFAAIVTRSLRMERIFRYIEAISGSSSPVTFVGPPGSGRKLLARTLADCAGAKRPFVSCMAQDLDGSRGGELLCGTPAATGLCQAAGGGVLLIEEIDRLSPQAQARIIDILKRGEFQAGSDGHWQPLRCRLLATSATDPATLATEGRFRRDLAVFLDSHRIVLPPLTERCEDIQPLVTHFIAQACENRGRRPLKCPEHLISRLIKYPFPGNIAELRQLAEAAVAASAGHRLSLAPFLQALRAESPSPAPPHHPAQLVVPGHFPTLAEAREILVAQALERSGGSQTIAARLLGITPPALNHLLKRRTASDHP